MCYLRPFHLRVLGGNIPNCIFVALARLTYQGAMHGICPEQLTGSPTAVIMPAYRGVAEPGLNVTYKFYGCFIEGT